MPENVLAFQGSCRSISTLPLPPFFPRAYLVFSAFTFLESHVISAEPVTLCCSPGPCWAKSISRAPLSFPCLPRLPQRKTDGFIVLFYSALYGVSASCPTSTTATFTVSSCLDMAFLSILYQPDILIVQLWSWPQRRKSAGRERRRDTRRGFPEFWDCKKADQEWKRDISTAGKFRQRDRKNRSEFLHCGMTGVLNVSTPTGILHEGDSKMNGCQRGPQTIEEVAKGDSDFSPLRPQQKSFHGRQASEWWPPPLLSGLVQYLLLLRQTA